MAKDFLVFLIHKNIRNRKSRKHMITNEPKIIRCLLLKTSPTKESPVNSPYNKLRS